MSRARLFDTVLDATGRPIAGASVAVYEPGTTTSISETLYADDTGGATLANPLATGADGSVLAYLDAPRRVDLLITAVGQTPRTVPDVGLFPDPADLVTDADLGDHVGDTDPHVGLQKESEKGAVSGYAALDGAGTVPDAQIPAAIARDSEVTSALAAYQLLSQKNQLSGYPGLSAAGFVIPGQLGSGTPDGTKYLRDDGVWNLPPGVSPTTTRGDIIKRGASADERLGIGTLAQELLVTDIGSGVLESRWGRRPSGKAIGSTSGPTTTSTTYVDLTDMSVTLTTTGGDLWVRFVGSFSVSAVPQTPSVALSLDGAAEVGVQGVTLAVAGYQGCWSLMYPFVSVAAGSHTVKVRWKVGAGTGTATGVDRYLTVEEK